MLIKNQKYVLHSLYVIYFMSLKLIKTTQKFLLFCNLLGVLIKKVLIKILNLSFIQCISLKFFKSTQNCLLFSNLLGSSYKYKSAYKKLKQ